MKKKWRTIIFAVLILAWLILFFTGDYGVRFWIGQAISAAIILLVALFMKHWGTRLE
ncbi:hypothetical protein JCM19046_4448 [Bacillus sp. JCM 19046]|uniref:Membrane protein n=1 Tax=Shouchella xiaoxiensis TaxID=766895 RepID=A0ABS2T279_9BACI|nr:hypothetical protein [Shouchella xiaoxiensis]MBM7840789.1 putative membrane protein [Shouchella xiaoxiensis]GAF13893.1 hypothetical protein JCM19045_3179 [Bacillus sp. JCM 19045]GAF19770.1 hypothetical protein JCM19046_4448 [Bacillus sp. JCM 19046]